VRAGPRQAYEEEDTCMLYEEDTYQGPRQGQTVRANLLSSKPAQKRPKRDLQHTPSAGPEYTSQRLTEMVHGRARASSRQTRRVASNE
jgi:hypothetical protein